MLNDLTIEPKLELRRDMERVCDDRVGDVPNSSVLSKAATVKTAVHDGVFKIFMGPFAAIVAIFCLKFGRDEESVFMAGICTLYGLMYFGTPIVLRRASKKEREEKDWTELFPVSDCETDQLFCLRRVSCSS